MIHFTFTGTNPRLTRQLFTNFMRAAPELQAYIGTPVLQVPLGTDEHPAEDSNLIHGPNTDFWNLVCRCFDSYYETWKRVPDLAYLDAEFKPKGKWLQMTERAPTPSMSLIARRAGIIRRCIELRGYRTELTLWSPAKHTGGGDVSDTQMANAEALLNCVANRADATWLVNCNPRVVGADHAMIVNKVCASDGDMPCIQLDIGQGVELPDADCHALVSACLAECGRVLIWAQADNDGCVAYWSSVFAHLAPTVQRATLAYHEAPEPEGRP